MLTTSTSCEKVMAVTNKQRLKVELTEIEIWWHDGHAAWEHQFEHCQIWEFRAGMWDLEIFKS